MTSQEAWAVGSMCVALIGLCYILITADKLD